MTHTPRVPVRRCYCLYRRIPQPHIPRSRSDSLVTDYTLSQRRPLSLVTLQHSSDFCEVARSLSHVWPTPQQSALTDMDTGTLAAGPLHHTHLLSARGRRTPVVGRHQVVVGLKHLRGGVLCGGRLAPLLHKRLEGIPLERLAGVARRLDRRVHERHLLSREALPFGRRAHFIPTELASRRGGRRRGGCGGRAAPLLSNGSLDVGEDR